MGHMGGTKDKQDGTTEIDRPWTDRKHLKHQIFSQKGRTMSGEVQTSCRTTLITPTLEEWQTDLNPLLTCSTLCGWVSFDVGRCTDYFLIRQKQCSPSSSSISPARVAHEYDYIVYGTRTSEWRGGISVVQLRVHRSYSFSQYSAFKCSESKDAEHNTEIPRRSRKQPEPRSADRAGEM